MRIHFFNQSKPRNPRNRINTVPCFSRISSNTVISNFVSNFVIGCRFLRAPDKVNFVTRTLVYCENTKPTLFQEVRCVTGIESQDQESCSIGLTWVKFPK